MAFLIGAANSAADVTFSVANSCRFNGSDSSLSKTVGDAAVTNAAFSCWFKRSVIGANQTIYATDSSNEVRIKIHSDDKLDIYSYTDDYQYRLQTNRLFRDPAAWYHLVIRVDTTNGTADNRIRVYINGTQETSFAARTNPGSSDNIEWFQGATGYIGMSEDGSSNPFGGYLAEIVMVDGSTTAHTVFGEFDEDSPTIWKPINVSSLSVGTNGWYLDFEASANLGNAADGGTDWTENNLAAVDQTTDTPTNNFATGNPIASQAGSAQSDSLLTFAEGNLLMSANSETGIANIGVSAGKWYWEVKILTDQDGLAIGACNEHFNITAELAYDDPSSASATGAKAFSYSGDGSTMVVIGDGTSQSYGSAISVNDIIGVALDVDSADQTCTFYLNGSSQGSLDITNLDAGEFYFPAVGNWSTADVSTSWNFGNPTYANTSSAADENGYGDFEYAPPSGYLALCTKNLGSTGG